MSTRLLGTPLAPIRGQRIRLSDPLMRGLVGCWAFNEGGGGIVADHSLYKNHGTWNGTGTHWAAGKFGWAGKFNGSSDYLNCGDVVHDADNDHLSAAGWVLTNSNGMNQSLCGHRGNPNSNSGWAFSYNGGATGDPLQFVLFSILSQSSSTPTGITLNNWHFIVATYDRVYIRFYVDGELLSLHAQTNSVVVSTRPMFIGAYNKQGSASNLWSGMIGSVAIYSRALTPAEIADLYLLGARAGFHTRRLFPAAAGAPPSGSPYFFRQKVLNRHLGAAL